MRGVYQKAFPTRSTMVGISLYHSVGDRERALEQLNAGFRALDNDVMGAAGWQADPYKPATGPIWDWWHLVGVPKMEEWQAFYADQWAKYSTRWATNWETYEHWQAELERLRGAAKAAGLKLTTPSPAPLDKSLPGAIVDTTGDVLNKLGKGAEDAAGDIWKILKVGLYGVLAIGGVVALTSVVANARQGRDPLEKYTDLYRKVRR